MATYGKFRETGGATGGVPTAHFDRSSLFVDCESADRDPKALMVAHGQHTPPHRLNPDFVTEMTADVVATVLDHKLVQRSITKGRSHGHHAPRLTLRFRRARRSQRWRTWMRHATFWTDTGCIYSKTSKDESRLLQQAHYCDSATLERWMHG
jgi:hypothetical protein